MNALRASEGVYRALLWFYPAEYRRAYAGPMAQLFCDMWRDAWEQQGWWGLIVFWFNILIDTVHSAVAEHLEDHRTMQTIPTAIDQYEVKAQVGHGAVGSIYRVHDPASGQDRALKMLNTEYRERFRSYVARMADLLRQLNHPALPKCHAFVDTDEYTYILLDFVEGRDLWSILESEDGFLDPAAVTDWGVQACELLIYLHGLPQPILVRDIKPANMMIDTHGQLLLVDFGIALPMHPPGEPYEKIGTIGYAAPEQYEGEVDMRSDVFGLGATLHHLLTRRDPRREEKFTFHDAPPRALNPAIPAALEAAVLKATANAPADRFQSAAEMKAALLAAMQ